MAIAAAGCGSSAASPESSGDAGTVSDAGVVTDARTDAPPPVRLSKVAHVVIIVQENHTFDVQFGAYCQAAAGSNPACTTGPACCEAMPATDPAGHTPTVLDDTEEAAFDPNHTQACELAEMDNGKMDAYATATVSGASSTCGDSRNVASASPAIVMPYWTLAQNDALADRYFQPVAGQSSSNDMYLARASYVFIDNSATPLGAVGVKCSLGSTQKAFTGTTIGDLLTADNVPWAWFAQGYKTMVDAHGTCPPAPADCPLALPLYPCSFDPSDIPFEYYASTRDSGSTMKDLSVFQAAITSGSDLPAVSFIKAIGYRSEHPGYGSTLSAGVTFVTGIVSAIEASSYAADTLVLLTYDEGGGFFDHVAPPPPSTVDHQPYGTRVPLLAIGPFAKKGSVSHVTMEHSSIVKFIEWNFLGGKTGQLGERDAVVNNLGSLLDPSTTGVSVPAN